jgi:hypothetical protein
MQRYVHIDLHEILFSEFPKNLTEWIKRLVEKTIRFSATMLKNWTPKLVIKLNLVSKSTTLALDFCCILF